MSTRANVVIKDKYNTLWFYRHSDGYPKGTLPTLNKFLDLVKEGKIRSNASQSAGWLIVIGALESHTDFNVKSPYDLSPEDWKVGAYEPTTGQHGDIEYLYTIDLDEKTITYVEV
jgi:hypothetical protein